MILGSSLRVFLSSGLRDPLRNVILRLKISFYRFSLHLILQALQRIHSKVHHPDFIPVYNKI